MLSLVDANADLINAQAKAHQAVDDIANRMFRHRQHGVSERPTLEDMRKAEKLLKKIIAFYPKDF